MLHFGYDLLGNIQTYQDYYQLTTEGIREKVKETKRKTAYAPLHLARMHVHASLAISIDLAPVSPHVAARTARALPIDPSILACIYRSISSRTASTRPHGLPPWIKHLLYGNRANS